VLEHAPAAAARAAAFGAHHEAAEQYRRALRHADTVALERRAELYESLAYELHLAYGDLEEALRAAEAALAIRRRLGGRLKEGSTLAFIGRVLWFMGRAPEAGIAARRAVEVLESLAPGPELALAYANLARLAALAHQIDHGRAWALRAIELAEEFGVTDAQSSALNTLGTSQLRAGVSEGWGNLERSRDLAEAAGDDDNVGRALVNLAGLAVELREYGRAAPAIERGMEYTAERELGRHRAFLLATRARWKLDQGEWDAALCDAELTLRPEQSVPLMRVAGLTVVGLVRARRGEDGAWPLLDEALRLAVPEELQQVAPVAAARAEAAWLVQDYERIGPETERAFALAGDCRSAPAVAELAYWRFKAGIADDVPEWAAEPHASQIRGDWSSAAEQWSRLGCPYDAALALLDSGEKEPLRRALAQFNSLGAVPAARVAAGQLRKLGVRRIDRGPRRSTLASPALLTTRQQEILCLLGDRLTNAEIAARLFISPKTVDHHVSAILGKLGVHSRHEAAAEAARLGLIAR
jgi:DNA-binding CsgD family transcriptional regulator/tetratricopeptide (TPR) repeat protein